MPYCWDGCYAIHPVEGASSESKSTPKPSNWKFLCPISSQLFCQLFVPVPGQGHIIKMSVIPYELQLLQPLPKKLHHFPEYSSLLCCVSLGLAWTVGYTAQHCPHNFWWHCYVSFVSISFQETDRNTDKMKVKYGQKTLSESQSICNLEHKWALRWLWIWRKASSRTSVWFVHSGPL